METSYTIRDILNDTVAAWAHKVLPASEGHVRHDVTALRHPSFDIDGPALARADVANEQLQGLRRKFGTRIALDRGNFQCVPHLLRHIGTEGGRKEDAV